MARADPNAGDMDIRRGDLLGAVIALLECCSRPIRVAQTACLQRLSKGGMRVQVLPPGTLPRLPLDGGRDSGSRSGRSMARARPRIPRKGGDDHGTPIVLPGAGGS
jgi:hypothetical protein